MNLNNVSSNLGVYKLAAHLIDWGSDVLRVIEDAKIKYPDLVQLLLAYGANSNGEDADGKA